MIDMVDSSIKIGPELVSEVPRANYNDKIVSVIEPVRRYGGVVVYSGNSFRGIVDSSSLGRGIQRINIPKDMSVGKITESVPVLDNKCSISDAIGYMHAARTNILPYSHRNKVTGIVQRIVLLKSILSLRLAYGVRARDIMNQNPVIVQYSSKLSTCISTMNKYSVSRLIVNDGDKTVGIVSRRDILNNILLSDERKPMLNQKASPSDIPISEIMVKNPISINYNKGVDDIIRSMVNNSISSLIVKRSSEIVGIVTTYDIFEYVVLSNALVEKNVHIIGFDDTTEEYKSDIEDSTARFMEKMGKLEKVVVESLSLRFKRLKDYKYEVSARVSVKGVGMLNINATGFYLERTVDSTLSKLEKMIIRHRNRIIGE